MKSSLHSMIRGRFQSAGGSVLAAALLTSAACTSENPPSPPFDPRYTTERLRIGTDFDAEICKGQLDLWEAHIDAIEAELGLDGESVWIYLFDDSESVAGACNIPTMNGETIGCWDGSVVYSLSGAVAHELVHAWTMSANPNPLPVLREGIADRFSGAVLHWSGPPYTVTDLVQVDLPFSGYRNAAHFVAWLMATYGSDRFMNLYALTSRGTSEAKLTTAFRAALGDEPQAVLAAYEKALNRYYPGMGAQACGVADRVPWQGDAAIWQATGSCEDGPLVGYITQAWQRISVQIPNSGLYRLDTGGRVAAMTQCLVLPTDESDVLLSPFPVTNDWEHALPLESLVWAYGREDGEDWSTLDLQLGAGTYEIWVYRDANETEASYPPEMSLRHL